MIATSPQVVDLSRVAVIIPALNEADNLRHLLPRLADLGAGQVLVCDNGSTDRTRHVTESLGATWVFEPQRGYGAACQAGLRRLDALMEVVAFVDADLSDDLDALPALIAPILSGQSDMVLGARLPALREAGSMSLPQRFANGLFPHLVKVGWGHRYADMGPFRAIRRTALDQLDMQDRAYGWTIEMQIRAVEERLRILEIPVRHSRRRYGRSQISGTVRGIALAGYWITRTCADLWLTRGRRLPAESRNGAMRRAAGCRKRPAPTANTARTPPTQKAASAHEDMNQAGPTAIAAQRSRVCPLGTAEGA